MNTKNTTKLALSLIILALIAMTPFSSALSLEDVASRLDGMVIPKEAIKHVDKIKVNCYLDDQFYSAGTIENGKIKLLNEKFDKPAIEVYTSTEVMDRIINSEDVELEAYKAYKNKEIKIVRKGLFNKIKFLIAEKVLKKTIESRYGKKI